VNYSFAGATAYPFNANETATGITSNVTSNQAFNLTSSGTATGPLAFKVNTGQNDALYMQPSSGTNTRYWQYVVSGASLVNYSQFKLYLQAETLPQGAPSINFAYSTDGVNYTFNGTMNLPTQNTWTEQVIDWSGVTALNGNNLGNLYIRLYANGSTSNSNSDATRLEIDNFQIQAFNNNKEVLCERNISGNVYNDGNCLTDNTVNGTPTNVGGALHVNLVDALNTVVATSPVAANGTYSFSGIDYSAYTLQLTTTAGTIGQPAPATQLPANWVNTGENIGTAAGNDGSANGLLSIAAGSVDVTNANFGIEQLPQTNNVTYPVVQVITMGQELSLDEMPWVFNGQDAEDSPTAGSMGAGYTFQIVTIPNPADGYLVYGPARTPVVAGQIITNFNPASLAFIGSRVIQIGEVICFQYALADQCGNFDPSPANYCLRFEVILPVTGLELRGKLINGNDAQLDWSTQTEINTSHFMIERSFDGSNFRTIGRSHAAAGNSINKKEYGDYDRNLPNGSVVYYRVRLFDRDGKSKLSNTVMLRLDSKRGLRVFPNPVFDYVTVEFGEAGTYDVDLLGVNGQQILKLKDIRITASNRSYVIQRGALMGGSYMLRITDKKTGEINNFKLIVLQR
jgi:hypothetical protein